jgi:ferritin
MTTIMDPDVILAWNKVINHKRYMQALYQQMATRAFELSLFGISHWLKDQGHKSCKHAKCIIKFLEDNATPVELSAIPAPPLPLPDDPYSVVMMMMRTAREKEAILRDMINSLYWLAYDRKNPTTVKWLKWLILWSEKKVNCIDKKIMRIEMAGSSGLAVLFSDKGLK